MPRISGENTKRISEQVLEFLYSNHSNQFFTPEIARELARDRNSLKNSSKTLKENLFRGE